MAHPVRSLVHSLGFALLCSGLLVLIPFLVISDNRTRLCQKCGAFQQCISSPGVMDQVDVGLRKPNLASHSITRPHTSDHFHPLSVIHAAQRAAGGGGCSNSDRLSGAGGIPSSVLAQAGPPPPPHSKRITLSRPMAQEQL